MGGLWRYLGFRSALQSRKSNTDWKRLDRSDTAFSFNGELIPIDLGFKKSVHGLQEVVAVELNVKSDEVGTKQPEQDPPSKDRYRKLQG